MWAPAFSARPSAWRRSLSVASPTASFALPLASSAAFLILSSRPMVGFLFRSPGPLAEVSKSRYSAPRRSASATGCAVRPGRGRRPDVVAWPLVRSSWRAVWAFSRKRFVRDNTTLTAQENRARDVVAGAKAARAPRFVTTATGARALDESALARARRLAGLKGYVSNIPATLLPPAEVISCHHDLWHVEQSFRMSKTDLAARPMFHRTRDAIEAHLTIVFTACLLYTSDAADDLLCVDLG